MISWMSLQSEGVLQADMSRKIFSTAMKTNPIIHFKRKLKEFQYPVIPPPEVPLDITKPLYAIDPVQPNFARYEGEIGVLKPSEIKKIRKSAQIASETLKATELFLEKKGEENLENGTDGTLTAQDIDRFVFDYIVGLGAYPTPIGFLGFPKSVCLSINECIVHGIPSMRPIYLGDKINLDVTAYYDGFHGDTNLTVIYGGKEKAPTPEVRNIMTLTQKALYKALTICKPGVKYSEIGRTIEAFANQNKVHVCEHFTGHGIGHLLHMPPMVYHVGNFIYNQDNPDSTVTMQIGHVFTIEPVMSTYPSNTGLKLWSDGMTVISDNNPNAQFEHMVLIVEDGCEILTQREGENIPNPTGNMKNLKVF